MEKKHLSVNMEIDQWKSEIQREKKSKSKQRFNDLRNKTKDVRIVLQKFQVQDVTQG